MKYNNAGIHVDGTAIKFTITQAVTMESSDSDDKIHIQSTPPLADDDAGAADVVCP